MRSLSLPKLHLQQYSDSLKSAISGLTDSNRIGSFPFEILEVNQISSLLDQCVQTGDIRTGRLVHSYLIKFDQNGSTSLWNKLLNLYNKNGLIQVAGRMFATMSRKDVVSHNTMISAYVQNGSAPVAALQLYLEMKEQLLKPNPITFVGLFGACEGGKELGEALHAQSIHYGLNCNAFVGCSILDGYVTRRMLKDAVRAFEDIAEVDLVSWNMMIDGCARHSNKEQAFRMFSQMLLTDVRFDDFTLTSIVKTCSKPIDLNYGMQIHGSAVKSGLDGETPICNSLVTMYSKCERGMESAQKVFGGILTPNIISWTAMIAGYMQNGQNEEAINLYKDMLRSGETENDFSFACILPVYGNLAELDHGRQIHGKTVKSFFGKDLLVSNALIDMYSKCGSLEDAHLAYLRMARHDVVSCTTMITAFGQHGKAREALNVLVEMTTEGLNADEITFLACLSACSHGGLLDEGLRIFRRMVCIHSLRARTEHFACIVDMLGRGGRLDEAERFIKDMGIESDVSVWETLLGACRLHGEVAIGKKSAERIMELQPAAQGAYVLLSNTYAEKGLWEDKTTLREKLAVSGLKKAPGNSWVSPDRSCSHVLSP